MAYEQRDNSGVLFKNDKKTSEKHPDYKGNAMIDGEDYWMSAWVKDGKNGKFMSFSFEPKEEQRNSSGNKSSSSKSSRKEESSDSEDMPF